jgi:hypothetical protein
MTKNSPVRNSESFNRPCTCVPSSRFTWSGEGTSFVCIGTTRQPSPTMTGNRRPSMYRRGRLGATYEFRPPEVPREWHWRPPGAKTIELPSRHWPGPFDPPLADLGGAMLSAIALANASAAQERSMISKPSFRSGIAAFAIGFVLLVAACGGAADRVPVAPQGTNTQPTTSSAPSPRPPQPSAPEPAATLPPQTPTATRGAGQPQPPGGPPPGSVADVPGEGLPDCGQAPAGQPCFGSPADVPGEGLPDCGQAPAGQPCFGGAARRTAVHTHQPHRANNSSVVRATTAVWFSYAMTQPAPSPPT